MRKLMDVSLSFWDDMLFKGVGLYYTILDLEKSEQQDSIWEARLPELDRYAKLFPRNVIYMRWKYEDALSKGNRLALGWYNRQGLQVMGSQCRADHLCHVAVGKRAGRAYTLLSSCK